MAAEAGIREEIQRKFRARLAQTDSETCDECPKPFRLRDVTLVGAKFICGQCQVRQVDRRADAVFHYTQNIIPNCLVLRTNDCE